MENGEGLLARGHSLQTPITAGHSLSEAMSHAGAGEMGRGWEGKGTTAKPENLLLIYETPQSRREPIPTNCPLMATHTTAHMHR